MPKFDYTHDVATLRYKIASDPTLIKYWANIANSLGYAWCAGTKSNIPGEDFSVKLLDPRTNIYEISANKRDGDPFMDGNTYYRSGERLKMQISDFALLIDPVTISYGTPMITSMTPLNMGTFCVINDSDTAADMSYTFHFEVSSSTSHTSEYSFTEGFELKQKWNAGIPGLGAAETEFTFKFDATQGWSNTTESGTSNYQDFSINVQVPPQSKRPIQLYAIRTQSSVDYSAKAVYNYNIKMNNFLAASWNARADHTGDRPYEPFTFGRVNDKADDLSAVEHLIDLYGHKDIPGYTRFHGETCWDWKSAVEKHPELEGYVKALQTDLPAIDFTGKFTKVDGVNAQFVVGDAVPLDKDIPNIITETSSSLFYQNKENRGVKLTGIYDVKNKSNNLLKN